MAGDDTKQLPPLVYRGAREIAGAVGVPIKELDSYVREHGLPAWKMGKTWLATQDDLKTWINSQRNKYLSRVD